MRIDPNVLAELCERHDIGRLRLFGSAARGEESVESDVDLIADLTRRKSLVDVVRIEREFSDRLGRKVDLLSLRSESRVYEPTLFVLNNPTVCGRDWQ